MPQILFDFTINIPVLITILGGFFVFGRWLNGIANTEKDVKKLTERMDEAEDAIVENGRAISALQALSDGYNREHFRRVMRHND